MAQISSNSGLDLCVYCGLPSVDMLCEPCTQRINAKINSQMMLGMQQINAQQNAMQQVVSFYGLSGLAGGIVSMAHPSAYTVGMLGYKGDPFAQQDIKLEEAGIRAGEIIAWRVWSHHKHHRDPELLHSMATNYTWHPGVPMTLMGAKEGERLYTSMGNGVHGFKTLHQAQEGFNYPPEDHHVYGTVALWGEVIEHEKGYRAEFGRINSLDFIGIPRWFFSSKEDKRLVALRKLYGVEGRSAKDFMEDI